MRLLFHAPNVHTGGGLRLMQEVLAVAPDLMDWAQIDQRAKNSVTTPPGVRIRYVKRSVLSRLVAEWRLARDAKDGDMILCFSGLPPLFRVRANTVVFLQNRLLIESGDLRAHPIAVRMRLIVERLWFSRLRRPGMRYVVQTPSMSDLLKRRLGASVTVAILPFSGRTPQKSQASSTGCSAPSFDFVYVSSGDAHKNHRKLIEAWSLLAMQGSRPSLALTVDTNRYPALCTEIDAAKALHGLEIHNLGTLPHDEVRALYGRVGALVFPSTIESLGLPLIEAAEVGLPILAPELDYVRDIVTPVETFDANSARSIARAILRFQGRPETVVKMLSATEFLASLAS